jgi:hypothetical protein
MPTRLYYSPTRRSYALFYLPFINAFRPKKILFRDSQYRFVPQKLDNIDAPERSMKILVESGRGFFSVKKSFYLIESYFRSKRDIYRIRTNQDDDTHEPVNDEKNEESKEPDIWETVVEKKDQQAPPSRRNSMR